jgi:GntR family transcriptional regulator
MPSTIRPLVARDRRPLCDVVREELRQFIRAGRFPPGERLPAEPDLARMLSVSRGTLREAIKALEVDGLLSHRRGVGTFVVAAPPVPNSLNDNYGVTQLIESVGLRPGVRWHDVREQPAGSVAAARLGIAPEAPTLTIERVRTADGRPVVHSLDIIPREIATRRPDFSRDQSVYTYLREACGQTVQYGIARLVPTAADRRLAALLEVRRGTLLMAIDQVDYTAEGRAVLFSIEHHLAEVFEFTVVRRGSGSEPARAVPTMRTGGRSR